MATRSRSEVPGPRAAGREALPPPSHRLRQESTAAGPELDAFFNESKNSLTGQYWAPIDSIAPVRLEDLSAPEETERAPRGRIRPLDLLIGAAGVGALVVLAVFVMKGMPDSGATRSTPPAAKATTPPAKAVTHPPEERRAPEPPKVAEASKPVGAPNTAPAVSIASTGTEHPAASALPATEPAPPPTTLLATSAPPAPSSTVAPVSSEASAAPPPKPRRKKVPKDHTPPTASFPD